MSDNILQAIKHNRRIETYHRYNKKKYAARTEEQKISERERAKIWRKAHQVSERERLRLWRASHLEEERERLRIWRSHHLEENRERLKMWAIKNPERTKERIRKWAQEHPEARIINEHRRRARKTGNGGTFSVQQWHDLKTAYGNMCLCCHREEQVLLALGLCLVPDHVISIAKGGSNDISNIQPLCHGKDGCNNHKSFKTIDYRGAQNANDNDKHDYYTYGHHHISDAIVDKNT
jgi:hypothetical protein